MGEWDLGLPVKSLEMLMDLDGCDTVINLGVPGRRLFLKRLSEAVLHSDSHADRTFLDQAQTILCEFENRYIRSITTLMERNQKPVISVHLNSITSGFPEAGGLLPEAIFIALAAGTPPCSIFSRTLIPEGSQRRPFPRDHLKGNLADA